jgi:hypothetical protein
VQKTVFLVLEYAPFDFAALFTRENHGKIALKDEHIKNLFH